MLQKILILTICLLAIATMVVANEANEEANMQGCVRCTAPDRMSSQCFTEAFCRKNRPGYIPVKTHPGHPNYDCVLVPPKWQKQVGNPCATRGYRKEKKVARRKAKNKRLRKRRL